MSLCLTGLQANNEDDDSDGEYTDDGTEETALESYQTPLDEETCPVDEYMIFKTVLQSKPYTYTTKGVGCLYVSNFLSISH